MIENASTHIFGRSTEKQIGFRVAVLGDFSWASPLRMSEPTLKASSNKVARGLIALDLVII